jgi:hypothetical protein
MKYKQCEIVQKNITDIVYLPEKFAKKNKVVDIEGLKGTWKVNKVFNSLEEKYCFDRSQDFKHQREASDV